MIEKKNNIKIYFYIIIYIYIKYSRIIYLLINLNNLSDPKIYHF